MKFLFRSKEGKFMLINLVAMLLAALAATMIAPKYGLSAVYNLTSYVLIVLVIVLFVYQVYLSIKLYKVAKEKEEEAKKNALSSGSEV